MKRFLFVLCCVFLSVACSGRTSLHDSDGRVIPASDYRGKWVVLNYWADWCTACHHEIPEMNAFYRHHSPPGVVIYGVSYDWHPQAELPEHVRKMHIAFPVIMDDPSRFWSVSIPEVLPWTVIIDPKGRVRQVLAGAQTETTLQQVLQTLLQSQ